VGLGDYHFNLSPRAHLLRIQFEWDPKKRASNLSKHGVAFEDAMAIFHDPLALTIPDTENSGGEERWVTVGAGRGGRLFLVVHTHREVDENLAVVRIISARFPTKREIKNYQEG
jgi:uncharacterized protein